MPEKVLFRWLSIPEFEALPPEGKDDYLRRVAIEITDHQAALALVSTAEYDQMPDADKLVYLRTTLDALADSAHPPDSFAATDPAATPTAPRATP